MLHVLISVLTDLEDWSVQGVPPQEVTFDPLSLVSSPPSYGNYYLCGCTDMKELLQKIGLRLKMDGVRA